MLRTVRSYIFWTFLALAAAPLPHTLQNLPSPEKHLIETMPGGLAVLDFVNDTRPDLFFTNGAHASRLYRNLGHNQWQDVTANFGLTHTGYTMGAAAADLLITGFNQNVLYRNLGQGKFQQLPFPYTGWSISAGFFDYDHDGNLDLFIVNYV